MVAVGEDGLVRVWSIDRIIQSCAAHPRKPAKPSAFDCDQPRWADRSDRWSTPRYDCGDSTRIIPSRLVHPSKVTGQGMVRSIAFSWDGSRLATASDDHTARVWDIADLIIPLSWAGTSPATRTR